MDDLDTLLSRVEELELPPGTRAAHIARISRASSHGVRRTHPAGQLGEVPERRRHTASAMVLTGAAVVVIMAGAGVLANTEHGASTAPMSQAATAPSAPST